MSLEKYLTANNLAVLSTFLISVIAFTSVYLEYKKKKLIELINNPVVPIDKNTNQVKQTFNISYLLMTLLNDCEADRVYVYLLDKSKNNYLDTFSCEFEFVTLGTSSEIFNAKINVKKHEKFFQDLNNLKILVFEDIETLPTGTKEFFIDRGNLSCGFALLQDKNNNFEGFLGLDFTKEKILNIDKVKLLLTNSAKQINYKINELKDL
jgi:hypothetical protein